MADHLGGAHNTNGRSCNTPVVKSGKGHRKVFLSLPGANPRPGRLISWAEYVIMSEDGKDDEPVWLRTVVSNYETPHMSKKGQMLGANLVEVPIGEGYAMHTMDTLCPDSRFSVITEPNEEALTTVSMSSLSWSDADVTTSIVFYGTDAWGIEELGILATTKTGKRLKELTRISKYHTTFGAGEVSIVVYDGPEIPNDGCSIIRPSLLLRLARTARERAYLRKHVKSGNLRVLTNFGLIKGDFIIARSDKDIEADVVTHRSNVKSELVWTGSQGRVMVGIMPHHDLYRPMTNVQTLSWAGEALFPADQLMRGLKRAGTEVYSDLVQGVYPSYLQYDGPTGSDLESQALLTGGTNLSNRSAMYERWLKAGRAINESAHFLYMIGNSFLNMNKDGLRFPVPWASGSHIISHELLARAGYGADLKGREDLVFYHKATGRISLPGHLVGSLYDNHGGWDLDDSIIILLRKFEDGVIRGIIIRTPNGRGEYSVVEVDYASFADADAIFHTEGRIPTLTSVGDLKNQIPPIQRINSVVTYRGLPDSDSVHLNGGEWTREAAEENRAAMSIAPGVGQWANAVMVSNTVADGPFSGKFGPKDQLAPTEAIVDALQQGASAEVFQVIYDWIYEIGERGLNGRKVDGYFTEVDYRLPADTECLPDKEGYLYKLAIAKKRYLASCKTILQDVCAHLRVVIPELAAQPIDPANRQWAIKVEKKYRKLQDSAPRATVKYSFRSNGVSGISRIVKRKLTQDYWEGNARRLVNRILSDDDPIGLVLALYSYSVECQVRYKRENGSFDMALFSSPGAGEVSVMDLLLEVLADFEPIPEEESSRF